MDMIKIFCESIRTQPSDWKSRHADELDHKSGSYRVRQTGDGSIYINGRQMGWWRARQIKVAWNYWALNRAQYELLPADQTPEDNLPMPVNTSDDDGAPYSDNE